MEPSTRQPDHFHKPDCSTPKSTLSPFLLSLAHPKQKPRIEGLSYSNPVSPMVKTPRRKSKLSIYSNHSNHSNSPLATSIQSDNSPRRPSFKDTGMHSLSKFCPPRLSNPNILDDPKPKPTENFLSPRTRKIISSKMILVKAPSTKTMNVPVEQKGLRRGTMPEAFRNTEFGDKEVTKNTVQNTRLKKDSLSREGNSHGIFDSVDFPSEDFDTHLGDSIVKQPNQGITRCSTMESSTHLGKTKLCLEPTSPDNKTRKSIVTTTTLTDHESHTTFGSPDSKVFSRHMKIQQTQSQSNSRRGSCDSKGKSSITLNRFAAAVEKAKIFNDGVILQYQFDKQNEEEEHDFAELCEMLQSKVKE